MTTWIFQLKFKVPTMQIATSTLYHFQLQFSWVLPTVCQMPIHLVVIGLYLVSLNLWTVVMWSNLRLLQITHHIHLRGSCPNHTPPASTAQTIEKKRHLDIKLENQITHHFYLKDLCLDCMYQSEDVKLRFLRITHNFYQRDSKVELEIVNCDTMQCLWSMLTSWQY